MARIYMDLSEDLHLRFKQCAKDDKRTLKGFLEKIINDFLKNTLPKKGGENKCQKVKSGKKSKMAL